MAETRRPLPLVGVASAAKRGRLQLNLALRELIASQLDIGCGARETSSLTILLLRLSEEIEEMTVEREPWEVADSLAELADS